MEPKFSDYFPFWGKLTEEQCRGLEAAAVWRHVPAGTVLHRGGADCEGLFLLCRGQLRAYILSDEGKEITLYRLFDRDMDLLAAPCIFNSIQFDVMIEAERETWLWVIPPRVYQALTQVSLPAANYTHELMAARFSEVMWLLDQILFRRFDSRLAGFLLEERRIEGADLLPLTHERIARHLGTAREVVTRMLKYFQSEGMVELSRGGVRVLDERKLARLAG